MESEYYERYFWRRHLWRIGHRWSVVACVAARRPHHRTDLHPCRRRALRRSGACARNATRLSQPRTENRDGTIFPRMFGLRERSLTGPLPERPCYHAASDSLFEMVFNGTAPGFSAAGRLGFDGKQTNVDEKRVDYVLGSGNHAETCCT